ncbi:BHLH domain-containing protein [Caerostris extrusa]|uniref:BHLH domain-containing protein n=1 Tax=Caerostris extrusa TaxID=172846 RepID=A0AAV4Y8U6_CAEEX|nr:BHLH domain-containing protein [Caerostris extrusa]
MALSASYGVEDNVLHTPKFVDTTFDFSALFSSKYHSSSLDDGVECLDIPQCVIGSTTSTSSSPTSHQKPPETDPIESCSSMDESLAMETPENIPVRLPNYNLRQRSIKNRIETEIRRKVAKKTRQSPSRDQRRSASTGGGQRTPGNEPGCKKSTMPSKRFEKWCHSSLARKEQTTPNSPRSPP